MLLDFFCIFSTGGLILWFKQFVSCKYEPLINYFIKTILLDQKRTVDSLSTNGTVLRWKVSDESNLVFVVAYQEAYSLLYVDKLVSLVMNDFVKKELPNVKKIGNLFVDKYDYTQRFMQILSSWESDCNKILSGGELSQNTKDLFKKPKSERKKKEVSQDKSTEKNISNSDNINNTDDKKLATSSKNITKFNSNIPKNIQLKRMASQKESENKTVTPTAPIKKVKEKTQKRGIGEYSEQAARELNM